MPKTRAEYIQKLYRLWLPGYGNAYGVLVLFLRYTRYLKISKRS